MSCGCSVRLAHDDIGQLLQPQSQLIDCPARIFATMLRTIMLTMSTRMMEIVTVAIMPQPPILRA